MLPDHLISANSANTNSTAKKLPPPGDQKNYPPAPRVSPARNSTNFSFFPLQGHFSRSLHHLEIMAGVKRSVDSAEDRNGKRSKTKTGSAVKKSKSDALAKKSDSSKKDKKFSKKESKPSKKKVEESEEEDDFDIDDVSDSGDDLDALDDSPANDVEMDDVEEEDSEENSDESEKKSPREIQAKSMSDIHIHWVDFH